MLVKDRLSGPVFDYVLTRTGYMRSWHLNSFDGCWVGWSLTSPAVMYTRIMYGPPTDSPACGIVWKTYTRERCDPARLFDHCHELWPLMVPLWLTCAMFSGFFPIKDVNWLKSLWNPQIWVILAYCSHFVEVPFHLWSYEIYDQVDNVTTWKSELMITKICWLRYLSCLA
jgi:hypothetical protein